MVELGEHCHTHIIPRLKKVIDGEDSGGITKSVNWKGGGGFRYYRLAPSLLEKDKWGNWVINKTYNAAMPTEALCKLEGFSYAPSDSVYWQHGHGIGAILREPFGEYCAGCGELAYRLGNRRGGTERCQPCGLWETDY